MDIEKLVRISGGANGKPLMVGEQGVTPLFDVNNEF